ncbi:MAG: phosphoenolpyruvate carboxykinase (ATP) [Flavobacteriales bacterium]|nr:phosphoenolpyruvate carboxykinase (ATP) [Flavobacteriales bacterium]
MKEIGKKAANATVASYGITDATAHWNLSPEKLAEISVELGQAQKTDTGAITVHTGEFTGRSPKDRFIVKDSVTEDAVWWGDVNIPFSPEAFDKLYDKVVAYLSGKEIYVRDSYVCDDPSYKMYLRVINEYAWSNLFAYNMFLRPSEQEIENFNPEWTVINAPGFHADPAVDGTRQHNFAILNFSNKIALVGGTGYTGEIKKGIFSALNFILPHQKNTLSMHCSANIGKDGDTAIFFGLSGTGKTTLSADPERKLIGDDEHGWSNENSVFNFEGGCYAKCIDLSEEKEPDIYRAIKPGALLENITFKPGTNEPDYADSSITENTRVSYPIYHIDNIAQPSIGHNPKNIFFLTCDAYGVLPPISKLTPGQAAYQFISGYTAKVAGTEEGITEPTTAFSACFGAPFMPLHPTKYGEMLSKKMKDSGVTVWLVNTGWSGGSYGVGSRMSLKITRALITAALSGKLDNVDYDVHEVFGLAFPTSCENVPTNVLNPRNTWADKAAYDKKANELAAKFVKNFQKFADGANEEIMAASPKVAQSA